MTVTHKMVSVVPDGPDTGVVRPSDWNEDHFIVPDTIANVLSDHTLEKHEEIGLISEEMAIVYAVVL